jgi:hypothetical protein
VRIYKDFFNKAFKWQKIYIRRTLQEPFSTGERGRERREGREKKKEKKREKVSCKKEEERHLLCLKFPFISVALLSRLTDSLLAPPGGPNVPRPREESALPAGS